MSVCRWSLPCAEWRGGYRDDDIAHAPLILDDTDLSKHTAGLHKQ
jgi:hypothetical protein